MNNAIGLDLPTHTIDSSKTALIIGAGLAGCAVANALAKRGYSCKLFDQKPTVAAATSAIPAAVIRPIASQDQFDSDFINKAFEVCCQTLDKNIFHQCGVLELNNQKKPTTESQAAAISAEWLSASEASSYAGSKVATDACFIKQAGWASPVTMCQHWLDHPAIEFHGKQRIAQLRQTEFGWQLLSEDETVIDESPLVIVANAAAAQQFDLCNHLPLQLISGQIDFYEDAQHTLQTIVSGNGYLIPQSRGYWCGATHHRDKYLSDAKNRKSDTVANRGTAQQLLPDLLVPTNSSRSFAATRTSTPDRRPIVGALPNAAEYLTDFSDLRHGKPAEHFPSPSYHQGAYIAAGFGSRGATHAAYVGQLLADLIADTVTDQTTLQTLHPARFLLRQLRRAIAPQPR